MTQASSRYCFALLVQNEPGVLVRILGLLVGRGYNVESLTVDEVDHGAHISRITMVTNGPPMVIDQIKAQLEKLIPVRRIVNLNKQGRFVERCLALIKIIGDPAVHAEARQIAESSGARVADVTENAMIFELAATPDEIDRLVDKLRPLGQLEVACSGSVGISCGATVVSVSDPLLPEKISAGGRG